MFPVDLWQVDDISRHYARYPVLPAPRPTNGVILPISPFASPSTQTVAQVQDHIGWTNLLLDSLQQSGQLYNTSEWAITLVWYIFYVRFAPLTL